MYAIKRTLAKAMVRHSVKNSDFDPVTAEENITIDHTIPEYNNSYYFTGHGQDGMAVMIRFAGRGNGDMELWFSLNVPGRGRFNVPLSVQKSLSSFNEGPLMLTCLEPVKKWRIQFKGDLEGDAGLTHAELDTELTSDYPIFHFTNDMDPIAAARGMAAQKWTREWFLTIQKMHQHHYEQGGKMKGVLVLDEKKYDIDMKFIRDHSFGPRSWDAMDRHIWLSGCYDNGVFTNLSLPDYPFIKLSAGFYASGGKYTSVVDSTPFHEIAPERHPADEFSYYVILDDKRKLDITCRKETGFTWLMDDAYRVIEWVSEFEMDGVKGRGICEFGFNVNKFNYGSI